jgi:hypothetical protein
MLAKIYSSLNNAEEKIKAVFVPTGHLTFGLIISTVLFLKMASARIQKRENRES